jgi:hypothetical protein
MPVVVEEAGLQEPLFVQGLLLDEWRDRLTILVEVQELTKHFAQRGGFLVCVPSQRCGLWMG